MERRPRTGRSKPGSRVTANASSDPFVALPHIVKFIETGGQISIGFMAPVGPVAIANDDNNCLAMLQRRDGETLHQLLIRLDAAIGRALRDGEFTDEINPED